MAVLFVLRILQQLYLSSFFSLLVCYRAYVLMREREPPRPAPGMTMLQFPLHLPLGILGMHTYVPSGFFKLPGAGLESLHCPRGIWPP